MVMQRVHVSLNSNFKCQQKRKFEEYIYDGVFTTSFEFINREKYCSKNSKDHIRGSSPPLASSTLAQKNENVLEGEEDRGYCGICMEDYSHLSDYEDSTKGLSYPMYLGNLMLTSFGDDDYAHRKKVLIVFARSINFYLRGGVIF
ncbi:hypothetical protein RYX36_029808 [Vicia faba]